MRDVVHETGYNVGVRDEAIIALLYDTGLRRDEFRQLDREWLDLEDETLLIPSHIQKRSPNAEEPPPSRTMELDPHGDIRTMRALRAYLNTRDDDEPALFLSNWGNRVHFNTLYRRVKYAAEAADVRPYSVEGRGEPGDVSPHTFRHSLAYRYVRVHGETLYTVKQRLRHSSIQTTDKVYSHVDLI